MVSFVRILLNDRHEDALLLSAIAIVLSGELLGCEYCTNAIESINKTSCWRLAMQDYALWLAEVSSTSIET